MNQDKKITMPRALWSRLLAMMERDGMATNYSEAIRHTVLNACDKSEEKAERERNEQHQ